MFEAATYCHRRDALRRRMGAGLVILVGASEAAINYRDNPYPFVQDGSFAYLFGLQQPDLIGLIDLDSGEEVLFGADPDLETRVWMGDLPSLAERGQWAGVARTAPLAEVETWIARATAQGRRLHFPPPYRGRTVLRLAALTGMAPAAVEAGASIDLVRALIALREIKDTGEVAEMERALATTDRMHRAAMRAARPGVAEFAVVAALTAEAHRDGLQLAYPAILSRRGEILHNHDHSQRLATGDVVINDSGASSVMGYASDITRTIPVGGRFRGRAHALYETVFAAEAAGIAAVRPGVPFVDIHKAAMRVLVEGMADFGVFRGDPAEAVETGAYAVVCPGGLGHQIGLDVHDMESLGEDHVGYGEGFTRSTLFGLNRLRLAKPLAADMVVTIEPGLYFIEPLIEQWAADRRHAGLIDYPRLRALIGAGGLRIEDEVLVTAAGGRVLGPPIPKTCAEIAEVMEA